jgi:hypothetical protein
MVDQRRAVYIGYDPREVTAFAIARLTCRDHLTQRIPIYGLMLSDLQRMGLFTRPIEMRPSAADRPIMWDVVSDAPMSTEHANARFFVPMLAQRGWALFTDGDVLFRGNVARLFEQLCPSKAVYCVKHDHRPAEETKMDGQIQTQYPRKNWTSVIAFNCDHPANRPLFNPHFLNATPGRDLHALCWLPDDDHVGALSPCWNYLVGHSDPSISATIAHFTSGVPDMPGYENQRYADEWFMARERWVRGGGGFIVDRWLGRPIEAGTEWAAVTNGAR